MILGNGFTFVLAIFMIVSRGVQSRQKWLPGRASLGLKRLPVEWNLLTPNAWKYSTVGVLCPESRVLTPA